MLPEMIGIGVMGWGVVTTAVIAVFVVKENGGKFSQKLSDQAVFAAVIGAFYSLAHGLVGAIWGAIVGLILSGLVSGRDSLLTALAGALSGSYFGPTFVAWMLLRYYTAAKAINLAKTPRESKPVQSGSSWDFSGRLPTSTGTIQVK